MSIDVSSEPNREASKTVAPWTAPKLRRLDAGSAENADQAGTDDGVNLS